MTSTDVNTASLKVLAGGSMTASLKELAPRFEKATGHRLDIAFAGTPDLIKQATSGAPFDAGQHLQLGRLHVSGRHDERARHRGERQDGWIHGGPSWGRVYHLSAPLHHWDGKAACSAQWPHAEHNGRGSRRRLGRWARTAACGRSGRGLSWGGGLSRQTELCHMHQQGCQSALRVYIRRCPVTIAATSFATTSSNFSDIT